MDIRVILTADPALLHAINRLADAFILSGAKAPETTHNGNGHTALRSDLKDLPQAPGSVQEFLRFSRDTLESINDATSPAELEACQQEIDFITDTFKGLIESGYLEQHVTRLDLALAMTRSRIQKKATPEPQLDELPKKQPKKKPAPDPEPSERKDGAVTLEDIQALSREKAQAGKKEGIKAALSRYEIAKISDLNPIDYLGFHLTISAL
jgi:hypothetical protein